MKSIIIGTAGHIDHGKTALVKALTGIDADRLQEEKRRGITIDLGFAHMDLPAANGEVLRIGFVDVPGHERFVRNMLAGVGGIDLVLLVISADESIKPQTREHFDILQLLGVQRGITVLTKSDAVDADTLDVVRLEVEEFLRGTFLEPPKAPIVAISSLSGAGLPDLKSAIRNAATQIHPRDSRELGRLPIDRVFTMKGFGTVVTGTLISGTIHREEELEAFSTGRRVRVRGMQVHGNAAEQAVAGQRTALNLAGATTTDLTRGMTLAPVSTFSSTRQADVRLTLLPSAPRPLKSRARVHFHSHTMETVAEIELHNAKQLDPGASAFARMKFPGNLLLLPGDRFIIRQFSPVVTIGGGTVLDATPTIKPRELRKLERTNGNAVQIFSQSLEVFAANQHAAVLTLRTTRRGKRGLTFSEAVAETGWTRDEIAQVTRKLAQERLLVQFQDRLFAESEFHLARRSVLEAVSGFHKREPLKPGLPKGELLDELTRILDMASALFEATLSALIREKKLESAGELIRVPGQGASLKDEEAESKRTIEDAFSTAGLKVPALHEVIAGLKIDKLRAQKIVTLLLREKTLIKISEELVFHRTALEELRRQITGRKPKSATIDVAGFKEMTGVSRKYAIPLLEYLDREGITKRAGYLRQIL